ncbi:lipopolysaccharide-assembly family protein [Chlamydia ibidis]|uniref:Lipopolysaccharide-assembly family protein n=2 Tax=Chlamydia ibidis TaxID=1405396 RepID=S7J3B3_9CHLA|nr:LPS assembly lipoprotein LptE [Chlamydia ibidis]EPP34899.1 lipopolysaccharide-assembly family protein [Chlamydia ibidis]EQM63126.1 putative lipoprotein [Chlamydia ibidis 10-1398/6]
MRIIAVFIFLISAASILSSCSGYSILRPSENLSTLGQSLLTEGITLAPIEQDYLGQLSSALIYELGKRSLPVRPNNACSAYTLKIEILNPVDENIGFTYAPNKANETTPKHFIVSNEGRLTVSAKVQLIENHSGRILLDQCVSRESVSFDFEPDLGTVNAHQFSLGQLEMHNEAIKSAWRVLYAHLAETIVQQVYYDLF